MNAKPTRRDYFIALAKSHEAQAEAYRIEHALTDGDPFANENEIAARKEWLEESAATYQRLAGEYRRMAAENSFPSHAPAS